MFFHISLSDKLFQHLLSLALPPAKQPKAQNRRQRCLVTAVGRYIDEQLISILTHPPEDKAFMPDKRNTVFSRHTGERRNLSSDHRISIDIPKVAHDMVVSRAEEYRRRGYHASAGDILLSNLAPFLDLDLKNFDYVEVPAIDDIPPPAPGQPLHSRRSNTARKGNPPTISPDRGK